MNIRNYRDAGIICSAGIIAQEVIITSKSTGWVGNLSDRQEIERILRLYNIAYTDDCRGTWERLPLDK